MDGLDIRAVRHWISQFPVTMVEALTTRKASEHEKSNDHVSYAVDRFLEPFMRSALRL